jgi:hypothetical protein
LCRFRKFSLTLMRHFFPVAPLTLGMIATALGALLIPTTGRPQRCATGLMAAPGAAVQVAPVATGAEEEELPTTGANDEPSRVHANDGAESWTRSPDCETNTSSSRQW